MIQLKIGNSACYISGLTVEQLAEVRELLSYRIDAAAMRYGKARYQSSKRYLIDKRGCFPTGLLYSVETYLKTRQLQYVSNDTRVRPKRTKGLFTWLPMFAPYPEQICAIEAAEAWSRGIICAPTGTGKSMICAMLIEGLQVPTLVVVPTLELKRQLTETLAHTFGPQKVGPLSAKRSIAVENVDALDPSCVLKGYDCVIIDEFHHSGAKTYRKLNKKAFSQIYYKYGLTATPFRSNDNERLLLESVLSQVIYRIDYQTAVSKGYIVPMEVYYYDLPKVPVEGRTWSQVYSELIVNRKDRNDLIAALLLNLKVRGKSTLCLVKEIAHGDNLADLTALPFASGIGDNAAALITEFNRGEMALIGTTGVLGEGVDTKPAEYIILAGGGKSKNQFMQQIGRGFRRYLGKETCKVIMFRDPSHKWTLAHFRACLKYLQTEFNTKPIKLDLTD